MKSKQEFTLSAIYDTETTNMYSGVDSRAFPCLFIVNDIRNVDINNYTIDKDDNILFFRYENEMINFIDELIEWGQDVGKIPLLAAYNMMFDMKPLMETLASKYKIDVCAQSSTHVYTLDLLDDEGKILLRCWDTFYLELNGLAAMGETCGIKKAVGDWDYSLIRTPETPLTKDEYYYASRDVQVIPAYLRYLLESNDWLKQSDFGCHVLTKTSLVRQMAKRKIGNITYLKDNGKKITQTMMFTKTCYQELPPSFESYGLRKACFRGGLTFTSANYSGVVVNNVCSLDVVSMHHAFINGVYIPVKFKPATSVELEKVYASILKNTMQDVLYSYFEPFGYGTHMLVELKNIRLKKNSCFEKWGIGIIPSAKFRNKSSRWSDDNINNYANIYAEEMNRLNGWKDRAKKPVFAFGKLYEAESVLLHLTEIELWCISRVYEWDEHKCILGEITSSYRRPPDYVSLQSNLLFGMKTDVKTILKNYIEGVPYEYEISDNIPENIKSKLLTGELDKDFLNSYYTSTVKGQFNSIYGTMAQDIYKPNFMVCEDGTITINENTQVCEDNWDEKQPKWCKVLYTYGMRIVGRSRMHLIIAMELLYNKFKDKIIITGGDTDSIKMACVEDISNEEIIDALKPLHYAIKKAIDITQDRIRDVYPNLASDLKDIGFFEIEKCGNGYRYPYHMEAWNKARISIDTDNKVHLTCAGLSRPDKFYNIEKFTEDLLKSYTPEQVLPNIICFNEIVQPCLSFALETHIPKTTDRFNDYVEDYLGNKVLVNAHESNALYSVGRWLGDINKNVNKSTILYLENIRGFVDDSEKILDLLNGNPVIYRDGEIFMQGVRREET